MTLNCLVCEFGVVRRVSFSPTCRGRDLLRFLLLNTARAAVYARCLQAVEVFYHVQQFVTEVIAH